MNPLQAHHREHQRCALVIVDMQNDFVLPGTAAHVPGAAATVPVIREALAFFRSRRWPVFHIVRRHRKDGTDVEHTRRSAFIESGGYAVEGTPGCAIVEPLQPLCGEYVIAKQRFSAFMNTGLDLLLRRLEIHRLTLCGTRYPTCVRASVFDAVALGYDVTLLTDATSARSPEVAEANIRDIKDIGVACVTLRQWLKSPI